VDYATSDNSAKQRTDYLAAAGTLQFAAGETSKTFSVLIIDDVYVEGDKQLNVTLSNPVGGTVGAPSSATLTIVDNDAAPPAANSARHDDILCHSALLRFSESRSRRRRARVLDQSDRWPLFTGGFDLPCSSAPGMFPMLSSSSLSFNKTGGYVFRLYRVAYAGAHHHQIPIPEILPKLEGYRATRPLLLIDPR